ncbi:YceI family protein [Pontibacter ramchanderi]|uniref:Polyisoprenoid-binding protein YceI n=1 Tax=Pontibacter ramchanderi TaxID=1179743 RepID=A0A2N3U922_9BACT|nr:YceI family protein [Pontibacter ramchanderi]PKV63242.1 polyisoprenoid-binding protein YceI [Pontibacter ramchanderi]
MKKTAILASMAAAFLFTACTDSNTATENTTAVTTETTVSTEGEAYALDPAASQLTWNGKKVGGEHSGNISLQGGELLVADDQVVGGEFTIDMASITNTDIEDAKYNSDLVGHLKSDDFFGVEQHPTANFKINSISPIADAAAGQPNYNVSGDLTIKGKTNPVTFPATINVENGTATAKADVIVDRAKYDVRYGSKSFFDDLGDKVIDDNFTVSLDIKATK